MHRLGWNNNLLEQRSILPGLPYVIACHSIGNSRHSRRSILQVALVAWRHEFIWPKLVGLELLDGLGWAPHIGHSRSMLHSDAVPVETATRWWYIFHIIQNITVQKNYKKLTSKYPSTQTIQKILSLQKGLTVLHVRLQARPPVSKKNRISIIVTVRVDINPGDINSFISFFTESQPGHPIILINQL